MPRNWLGNNSRVVDRRRDRRPSQWDAHGQVLSAACEADATTGAAATAPTAPTRRNAAVRRVTIPRVPRIEDVPPYRPGLEQHDAARRAGVCRLLPLSPTDLVVRHGNALAFNAMSEQSGCRPRVLTLALPVAVVCPLTPAALPHIGADPAAVRTALKGGFADSTILQQHGARMTEGNFIPGGLSELQLKDLENALAEAESFGIKLPTLVNTRDRFQRLVSELGGAKLDHSALYLELCDQNGLEVS